MKSVESTCYMYITFAFAVHKNMEYASSLTHRDYSKVKWFFVVLSNLDDGSNSGI